MTLAKQANDKARYMREFEKAYHATGALPPLCADDWSNAEFHFCCRSPAAEMGRRQAEHRLAALSVAQRFHAKIWQDADGVCVGPASTPEPVQATIRAAFANGCTHGTVTHWAGVTTGQPGAKPYTYRPELYVWETI